MSTKIRAEISARNEYYILKHRYYELKHFCLQYNEWKREYNLLEPATTMRWEEKVDERKRVSDSTATVSIRRLRLRDKILCVQQAAEHTDCNMAPFLIEAVTNSYSYETMLARRNVPCCREVWYSMYRRFFYILDQIHDNV